MRIAQVIVSAKAVPPEKNEEIHHAYYGKSLTR